MQQRTNTPYLLRVTLLELVQSLEQAFISIVHQLMRLRLQSHLTMVTPLMVGVET